MEALQKMSDPKLTDCPSCEAPALKKQVTAAAFKLKGTGWYETDFKNSGKKPAAKVSGSDTASADTGSNAETKPAASGAGSSSSKTSSGSAAASSSD